VCRPWILRAVVLDGTWKKEKKGRNFYKGSRRRGKECLQKPTPRTAKGKGGQGILLWEVNKKKSGETRLEDPPSAVLEARSSAESNTTKKGGREITGKKKEGPGRVINLEPFEKSRYKEKGKKQPISLNCKHNQNREESRRRRELEDHL